MSLSFGDVVITISHTRAVVVVVADVDGVVVIFQATVVGVDTAR